MAVSIAGEDELHYVRVLIETTGNLDLANLARFLQRIDTATRKVAKEKGWKKPTIEIASITTSSIDLKLKIIGLRVAQASLAIALGDLALGVAEYIKKEPAASTSAYILLNEDRATSITVEGGGRANTVVAADLPETRYFSVSNRLANRSPDDRPSPVDPTQLESLTGPQAGTIRRYGGENFVELDARPGLFISIRDERADQSEFLEDMTRYVFEGEAHIPSSGRNFYVINRAMKLG